MIVVDGSFGEGGGQILRTALGLAVALRKPVKVVNIRAKRKNPGLRRQHLTAVKVLATISNARVEGLRLGSTEIVFEPRELRGGRYRFDIGTAGSITLVLQALIPALPFTSEPLEIELVGGTDVPWSPPIDYVRFVLIPILSRMGYDLEIEVKRRGHYPRGGGIVKIRSRPRGKLDSIELIDRGKALEIVGVSHAVKLPRHVAERQANAAKKVLEQLGIPIRIDIEWYPPHKDPHLGPGSGIVVAAKCENSILGGDALGAKGKPAEKVGEEAATKLLQELRTGAALDKHMGDMIVAPAALACGTTRFKASEMTMHAYTVIELVKLIVGTQATVRGELGQPFEAEIRGICLER